MRLEQAVDAEDALAIAEEDLDDAREVQHRLRPIQRQLAGDVIVLQVYDQHLRRGTATLLWSRIMEQLSIPRPCYSRSKQYVYHTKQYTWLQTSSLITKEVYLALP